MAALGRWAVGSTMPDSYDRNDCVTELNIRRSILDKIGDGWRPTDKFEVPKGDRPLSKAEESSVAADTAETSSDSSDEEDADGISKL